MLLLCAATIFAQPLRIATFNVKWLTETATETRMAPWKDDDELAGHRAKLAAIIAKIKPDVIALQEVTTRGALELLVADPALKPFRYRPLHIESEDHGTGQDVAFLISPRVRLDSSSGAGIRRFADTLMERPSVLKKNDPRKQRLTKHALVCFYKPIKACALSVHLLAHPDDRGRTGKRETQARITAHLVRTEIIAKGYKPIVLGDFNDFDPEVGGPSTYANKNRHVLRIIKDYDTVQAGPELINVAGLIHPPIKRYSSYWDRNRNKRHDASDPLSLLDHILVSQSLANQLSKVEIRHDAHRGDVSDHWPVVVEIKEK
jgi:endonuclease/exonuclease/phosphatase family metal-dependent hydrolase